MTLHSSPPVEYPLDSLVSFHYYRRDEDMQALVDTRRLRMIGDSGAFSALTQGQPIKMPEYLDWVKRWHRYLCWTATLDVIGDPAATLANFRLLRDRHQLVTVPTLHVGTDPRWMAAYARDGVDFMGLGGMVGRALQSLPWIVQVFRYARTHHPDMRFHIWGVTHRKVVGSVPAYSADSSGFGSGYRYAYLRLFDPRDGKWYVADLRKRTGIYKQGQLLRQVYRTDPQLLERPTPENRQLMLQLAARGYQLYASWLQRRHNVPPPTWGLHWPAQLPPAVATTVGTRVHAVTARAGGIKDDLETAVTEEKLLRGMRVHAVDAHPANLLNAAGGPSTKEHP